MENEDDFEALRHISTWATCGFQRAEENGKDEAKIWTVSQKEELGRKAKVLLEIGRIAYLKTLGFDVKLFRYTNFSLENLLIFGEDCNK